jgi:hypothetical protein
MKNDLTTGAWQHNIGSPIRITLLSTSDAPPSMGEVKTNNQLAMGVSKAGGGWQESINRHTAMLASNYDL